MSKISRAIARDYSIPRPHMEVERDDALLVGYMAAMVYLTEAQQEHVVEIILREREKNRAEIMKAITETA